MFHLLLLYYTWSFNNESFKVFSAIVHLIDKKEETEHYNNTVKRILSFASEIIDLQLDTIAIFSSLWRFVS